MNSADEALAVVRQKHDKLRGQLFGAIEAVGLPERQENAIKGLIRRVSYEAQAELEAAIRRM